jgi:hypothetical protein
VIWLKISEGWCGGDGVHVLIGMVAEVGVVGPDSVTGLSPIAIESPDSRLERGGATRFSDLDVLRAAVDEVLDGREGYCTNRE